MPCSQRHSDHVVNYFGSPLASIQLQQLSEHTEPHLFFLLAFQPLPHHPNQTSSPPTPHCSPLSHACH